MARASRPVRIEGTLAYVPLTKGYEAVIDVADVQLVSGFCWAAHVSLRSDGTLRSVYARRSDYSRVGNPGLFMHRLLAGGGGIVDHIDCDGLNNQRSNLRLVTPAQNSQNQRRRADNLSGVKGVGWHKLKQKWQVRIRTGAQRKHIGLFDDLDEAAAAYAKASAELHGEFGRAA